jgi:hypothetical protein
MALLGVLALSVLSACKVHYVDTKAATVLTETYFSNLEHSKIDDALKMYSARFDHEYGQTWKRLLVGLDERYGPVTGFEVIEARIVPVSEVGCTLVQYRVRRGTLVTNERLIICPERDSTISAIVGHELTRQDTQQRTVAGIALEERKLLER